MVSPELPIFHEDSVRHCSIFLVFVSNSDQDKYGRLLRLIFLPLDDGTILFVNDYLVREGFAKVMTYPPDIKYNEKFREAEAEAKAEKRGLWGKCN